MPVGSKLQVFRGTRTRTPGGLTKQDLVKNKRGKVVSKKSSAAAKKSNNLRDFRAKKAVKKLLPKRKRKKPSKFGFP